MNSELCNISVEDRDGTRRQYQYEFVRRDPREPTIVFIPGGPGGGYIGLAQAIARGRNLPSNYNFILIDPRGVGKNDYGADPEGKIYSQGRIVDDLISVIKSEGLQNYLIEGTSHGSVLATELASRLSNGSLNLPKPQAVILSGVVPKFFSDPQDYFENFNKVLKKITDPMSAAEKDLLKKRLQKIASKILGGDQTWLLFLMQFGLMTNDQGAKGPQNFTKLLQAMASPQISDEVIEGSMEIYVKMFHLDGANDSDSPADEKSTYQRHGMAETIGCRELNLITAKKNTGSVFRIDTLKFEQGSADFCASNGYKLDRPFRAKDFQISGVPIFYVQGDIDPATPAAGAKEHYSEQLHADKIYIEMIGQAHTGTVGLGRCGQVWKAFSEGIDAVKQVLENSCPSKSIRILGVAKVGTASASWKESNAVPGAQ